MSDESHGSFEAPSALGVVGSASAVALTATVLVFVLTAWGWHGTVWAMANYGAFVVLPLTVVAALLSRSVGKTLAAMVVSAICGGPLYVWELPEVRAAVAEHAGAALPGSTVMLAIQDQSKIVADAACVSLVSRGYDNVRFQLPELIQRPDVVASCLTQDVEGTDAPALLRREVAQMWEGKILASNTANVCKLIPDFVTVSGAQTADMPARILRIATTAAHPDVRVCAMEHFAQQYPTPLKQLQALGNPGNVDPVVGAELFRGLTTITYAPLTEGIHKKMTNTPLMKQWGLSLGCRLLVENVNAVESAPMLNTAVSLQGCGKADGENALSVWSQTCSAALEGSRDGLVTTSSVCDRIHTFALDSAIATASTIVHAAIERLTQQELQREIERGNRESQMLKRIGDFSGMNAADRALDGMPALMAQDMRRQLGGVRSQTQALYGDMRGPVKGGVSKGMLELFVQASSSDSIHGMNVRKEIRAAGGDPDDLFSNENMAEIKSALKDKKLDQSSVNIEGADVGIYESDAGMSVEEMIGNEQERERATPGKKNP